MFHAWEGIDSSLLNVLMAGGFTIAPRWIPPTRPACLTATECLKASDSAENASVLPHLAGPGCGMGAYVSMDTGMDTAFEQVLQYCGVCNTPVSSIHVFQDTGRGQVSQYRAMYCNTRIHGPPTPLPPRWREAPGPPPTPGRLSATQLL